MTEGRIDFGTDRILITGAGGWLGRGVLDALLHGLPDCPDLRQPQPGLSIRALAFPAETGGIREASEQIEVVTGDLRSPEICARVCEGAEGAVLLHLAGVVHPRRSKDFFAVNVGGTENILDAAITAGVRRALVISSNSPCGCNPDRHHRFDEESPYNPYMGYGRSKMLMEQAALKRQAQGRTEVVIIRAPWFYGPYQPPRQTAFFRMIRDGKAPIVGGGQNLRSMAYIGNLAQGLLQAAVTPGANGQIYWIADESPYSMIQIVDTVEKLLEEEFGQPCKHRRLRLPGPVSDLAWVCDWCIQAVGLYHQKMHVLSEMNKTIACSIEKARRELNYRPAVALEEGMRRSLKWVFEKYGGL